MADVAAVKAIKDTVGDRMDVMANRTAQYPGSVWVYGTAYRVARELEDLGASWLEEPFHHGDVVESARLAQIVKRVSILCILLSCLQTGTRTAQKSCSYTVYVPAPQDLI